MILYCCKCELNIEARLTDGSEIYAHRKDLHKLPFWKCDECGNFVGCHHKTNEPTKPLGCIPSPEIKEARKHIHRLLDPIWKSKRMKRQEIYKRLSNELGYEYHTASITTIDEARNVYRLVRAMA